MNNAEERTFTAYGSGALVSANEGEVIEISTMDGGGSRTSKIEGPAMIKVTVHQKEEHK